MHTKIWFGRRNVVTILKVICAILLLLQRKKNEIVIFLEKIELENILSNKET